MHGLSRLGHKLDVELARHELAAARAHLSRGADGPVQPFTAAVDAASAVCSIRLQLVEGIAEPRPFSVPSRACAGGRRGLEQALADVGALLARRLSSTSRRPRSPSRTASSLAASSSPAPRQLRVELLNLVAIRTATPAIPWIPVRASGAPRARVCGVAGVPSPAALPTRRRTAHPRAARRARPAAGGSAGAGAGISP